MFAVQLNDPPTDPLRRQELRRIYAKERLAEAEAALRTLHGLANGAMGQWRWDEKIFGPHPTARTNRDGSVDPGPAVQRMAQIVNERKAALEAVEKEPEQQRTDELARIQAAQPGPSPSQEDVRRLNKIAEEQEKTAAQRKKDAARLLAEAEKFKRMASENREKAKVIQAEWDALEPQRQAAREAEQAAVLERAKAFAEQVAKNIRENQARAAVEAAEAAEKAKKRAEVERLDSERAAAALQAAEEAAAAAV